MKKICIFHNWYRFDKLATHYWIFDNGHKWYTKSIGRAVCIQCGKLKDKHRFKLKKDPDDMMGEHVFVGN